MTSKAHDDGPRETQARRGAPTSTVEERRLSRTETAYYAIADRLADLRFRPGSRFTEAEVAAQLGMSKTPVREALLMHVTEGLVSPRPGAGYVVMPITLKDVRALFGHWRRLAGDAVVAAAKHGTDSSASLNLQGILEDEAPFDRHRYIFIEFVALAEDPYLFRDYRVLSIEIERLLRLVLTGEEEALTRGLGETVAALAAADAKAARSATLGHIDHLERVVLGELLSGDLLQGANLATMSPASPVAAGRSTR